MKPELELVTDSNPKLEETYKFHILEGTGAWGRRCPYPFDKQNWKSGDTFSTFPRVGTLLINSEPSCAVHASYKLSISSYTPLAPFHGHSPWGEERESTYQVPPLSALLASTCGLPRNISCSTQQVLIMWTNICSRLNHVHPRKRQTFKDWG